MFGSGRTMRIYLPPYKGEDSALECNEKVLAGAFFKERGEILWMVMLLLVLLGMGMMHISNQQRQFIRTNHWQDIALRMDHEIDAVLSRFASSLSEFPGGVSRMGDIHRWPNASLSQWRQYPGAYHQTFMSGGEVHVILEMFSNKQTIYRLNALGYHPSGTLLKKQWVILCEGGMCRRLSCIMW